MAVAYSLIHTWYLQRAYLIHTKYVSGTYLVCRLQDKDLVYPYVVCTRYLICTGCIPSDYKECFVMVSNPR